MTRTSAPAVTWIAVLGPLGCLAAMAYAHVVLPVQPLISDYALVSGGVLPIVLGSLALAAGCVSLAYGLAVREPVRSAATRVLLVAAAAGLILSAAFPTDPAAGVVNTLGGEIHRWSAAVVFTTLPVAGWALARARGTLPGWSLVRSLSTASALTLAVYLAAHPASFLSDLINGPAYYGLLERALLVGEIALVVTMSVVSVMSGASGASGASARRPQPDAVVAPAPPVAHGSLDRAA